MSVAAGPAFAFELSSADLGYNRNAVLSDVDLQVKPGELVGVLGRSGAGKSTLLAALAGASVQLGGSVKVNGIDPRRAKHPIGLVPQLGDEIVTRLSVTELVALGSPRAGLFTSKRERVEVAAILERLGLQGFGSRRLDELSGGQRQRVAIARALIGSTHLLLCDEPTSGADPVLAAEIVDVLAGVARAGTTVLVATHDLAVVAPRLDRLIGLGGGGVRFDGAPDRFDADARSAVYGSDIAAELRR